MRVRVTHGIELSQVPNKIKEMVQEIVNELGNSLESLEASAMLSNDLAYLPAVVDILDRVRKNLTEVDQALADSHAISSGLVRHLKSLNAPSESATNVAPSEDELKAMSEMLADVGDKIDAINQESDVHQG